MSANLLLELLRFAAYKSTEARADGLLDAATGASDREFYWLLDSGLGPLLYQYLQPEMEQLPVARRDLLHGSELVAQVRYGDVLDTATEVIDAAASVGVALTVLKGISIGSQFYPDPHQRTMSDVDVLLPGESYSAVEATILQRGYARGPYHSSPDLHHGIPLYHIERGTWVELHTGLFPRSSELLGASLFSLQGIAGNSVESEFGRRPVRRLKPELQLIYVGCTWNWDMMLRGFHPSFVAALFDAVYLLRHVDYRLDWDKVESMLDNEMATAMVLVLLSFLVRHRLCPEPPILMDLAKRQHLVGPIQLRTILACVDHYLLGGRTWRLPLPPPVVGRYGPRRQFHKRVRPLFGGDR